ncbi:MAG: hypothetical protein M0R49_08370 [Limnochordia bacterium]|nr:hypothetical protein [Limnochordia bacterium]
MALLTREGLLKKEEMKIRKVELGGGDFVFVRQMSAKAKDQWEQLLLKQVTDENGRIDYVKSLDNFKAKLAVATVCDENGTLILTPEDFDVLSENMTAAKLERIIDVAQELNRIDEADKEAMVKNSESDQIGDSVSASAKQ